MRLIGIFLLLFTLILGFQNCSDVTFSSAKDDVAASGDDDGRDDGLGEDDFIPGVRYDLEYEIPAQTNQVDILFSIDTSGSMTNEQQEIGARFQNFIDALNAKGLDWRIAVTIMDIHATSNELGANGTLIPFVDATNGATYQYLDKNIANAQTLFEATVQRPINCHGTQNCNDVERGTYNVNKYLDNIAADPTKSFIRKGSNFSVVYLSDEDVKSTGENLETYDLPQKLIANVQQTLAPQTFTVSSIVTRPGDNTCLSGEGANYGDVYKEITDLTKGILGDICATDYTSQLQNIGNVIASKTKSVSLPCYPNPNTLVVTVNPNNYTWVLNGNQLDFNTDLAAGTKINASFECVSNPVPFVPFSYQSDELDQSQAD